MESSLKLLGEAGVCLGSRNWIEGSDRQQTHLLPAALEDYVGPDNPVRFLAAFVATLDLRAAEVKAKIIRLQERQAQIQERLQTLARTGETQLSKTDPDSRTMKSHGRHVVGYHVQGCVDAKHHLLVAAGVTNTAADQGQLASVAHAAKAELQITRADVAADGGYYPAGRDQDIKTCQEMGWEPHLPAVQNSPGERAGLYGKSDFRHDAARDVYHCPGGAELSRRRQMEDKGKTMFNYDNPKACAGCELKARCTSAAYRTVSRWEHEASLERMAAAVAASPGKLAARKTLIESRSAGLGHGEVAVVRRIFGARQSQSGGRGESGALWLQSETGAGGRRTGKVGGGVARLQTGRPSEGAGDFGRDPLATNGGGRGGVSENGVAWLGRRSACGNLFCTAMKAHAVFHTGSERRLTARNILGAGLFPRCQAVER